MIRNILAATGVVLLIALFIVAGPAMGKTPHRTSAHATAITDRHAFRQDVWRPDTRSIA